MLAHRLKGGDVGSREQNALLSGHLVGHHVAALLGEKVAGKRPAGTVFIRTFDEKVTHPNFGGSGFRHDIAVRFDIPNKVIVPFADHLGHLAAVHYVDGIVLKYGEIGH